MFTTGKHYQLSPPDIDGSGGRSSTATLTTGDLEAILAALWPGCGPSEDQAPSSEETVEQSQDGLSPYIS